MALFDRGLVVGARLQHLFLRSRRIQAYPTEFCVLQVVVLHFDINGEKLFFELRLSPNIYRLLTVHHYLQTWCTLSAAVICKYLMTGGVKFFPKKKLIYML